MASMDHPDVREHAVQAIDSAKTGASADASAHHEKAAKMAEKGARAAGTPFLSFFTPEEMLALAREAGFREARYVSASDLGQRYFAGRTDGFRLGASEELLVATTT